MGFFSSLIGGFVGFLIGGPVGAVIGAGLGATKVGEKAVNAVMDFVLQPFMPKLPDMPDGAAAAEREQGVLLQRQGSTVSIPVVYGYRKLGGIVTYAETGSTSNKYLYVTYVFCEGAIEGLREVYIDDWLLPVSQVGQLNGGSLVTVNADRYANRVQLRFYPGVFFANPRNSTVGSTVKADIFAEAPNFSPDMVHNGLAVLFARYEWRNISTQEDQDNNPFKGNIPDISVGLLGKRVASLLVNTTETQSYAASPVRYSTNPAECLLDYLRNPRYGKGLLNSDIDFGTFKAAARKCNQTVTYLATQNITGPILTLNMVVGTDTTLMSNVKMMLQNFRAYMPYVQGRYKLRIEDAGNDTDILSGVATIVAIFNKDNIVSDLTYTGIERSSKYNVVQVTYVDPDQKFSTQAVVYPEEESERQEYIDIDGGRENKFETTLGGITNYAIAKDMARLIFNKQRRQESVVFTATSQALEIEPGDCIRIQANLLNFGTDPWRVVSVKINNDMTVDLGCVRNPDDIYPYTRVGEEDIVLPTFVPKGSIIYFPSAYNLLPLGLVPPLHAVFPPVFVPTPISPPVTNPDAPGGGGVGGGNPPGGTTPPGTPAPVPVPPDNIPPREPPPPPPFNAVVTLKSSRALALGTGNFNFNLVFVQPQDALYEYSIVWWRYNSRSPYTEVRLDTRPGPGGDIPYVLNNLGFGQYEYYVRSFASDGRPSLFAFRGQINFPQNVAELNPNLTGIAGGSAIQITAGWQPPASLVPEAPRYDDNIDFLELRPKLTSGSPSSPRRMRVVMTQIVSTVSTVPNFGLKGVRVYYKFRNDDFYEYEDFNFAGVVNYAPGTQVAFDLTGDFGAPGTGNVLATYDFVIRLTYTDGTAPLKQMGPVRANIETHIGLVNFVAVGTGGGGGATSDSVANFTRSLVIPQGFSLRTVDEDPNRAYANGSAIVPNINDIRPNNTLPELAFIFNPPVNTKWRGYKIRFRLVVPGTNQTFAEQDTGFAINPTTGLVRSVINGGTFRLNAFYDWVITAQFFDTASNTVKDADTSLVCRASVAQGIATYYNTAPGLLNTIMVFTEQETTTALATLRTAFPALPTPDPKAWIKKSLTRRDVYAQGHLSESSVTAPDVVRNALPSQTFFISTYYAFKFQMPNDTFDSLVVHRRQWSNAGAAKTTITNTAKFTGLGIWEKVLISRFAMTKGADGLYTAFVRGPLSFRLFDTRFQVNSTATLFQPQYDTGTYPFVNNTTGGTLTNIFPYGGAGNTNHGYAGNGRWNEWLFSIKDAGVESTKAIRVKDFFTADGFSDRNFATEVDGFLSGNISKLDVVTLSDFNTFEAGYRRNINEALTTFINPQQLQFGLQQNQGAADTYPSRLQVPSASTFTATTLARFIVPGANGDSVF